MYCNECNQPISLHVLLLKHRAENISSTYSLKEVVLKTSSNLIILPFTSLFTLFGMRFFGAAHGWGEANRSLLPKNCHTYSTTMKSGSVIPYLKKIQKLYNSLDATFEFWKFTGEIQIWIEF